MKTLKSLLATMVACFILSASFGASFIKFDGVDGESKDKDHKGWIDILSVSGLPSPRDAASGMATGKRDAASGMATGKRQHKPLTVTKRIDKSSPLFQQSGTSGSNPLYGSRMTVEQNGVIYVLGGVKVTAVKRAGPNEILTVTYSKITTQNKGTRATDYNSSRSNKSEKSGRLSPKPATGRANHNTTRSNK